MAEVSAPELLGIIDVMTSVLQRGREVQQLATSSSAAPAPSAAEAGGSGADGPANAPGQQGSQQQDSQQQGSGWPWARPRRVSF